MENDGDPPSFGNDDFMSDLDSANIIYLMRNGEGLSFLEAQAIYYNMLETGEITRSTFFVDNVVDLETVRREITRELVSDLLPHAKEHPIVIDHVIQNNQGADMMGIAITKLFEDENLTMEILRELVPDTYNFIRTLEEGLNDMEDFANR